MKNSIGLIIALFALTFSCSAQKKITQGKLVMDMSVPDSMKKDREVVDFIHDGTIIYFKDSLSRTEVNTQEGKMIIIYNDKSEETIICIDMMETKMAMKETKGQANEMKDTMLFEKPKVKLTNDTKKIAGFKCKRAIVTRKVGDNEITSDEWYTNELAVPVMKEDAIEGIDGYALETVSVRDTINVKMTCKSFEKMNVPDSLFVIPAGYELMDINNLMKEEGE
jgi:GLPGLI family protein